MAGAAGKLYVVSLGIGNLQDVTARALSTLQEVDIVLAEDTRQIAKFANLQKIPTPKMLSYRDQNHDRVISQILALLAEGSQLALVSDRGTPTISDPGYKLVRDVAAAGFEIVTIPGASAVIAALSISGLPTDRFSFLGFLPRTKGKQIKILKQFIELSATFIAYESPYRVRSLVETIQEAFGDDVDLALAHELTKQYEGIIRGKPSEVLEKLAKKPLGEWVVMGRAA